MPTFDVKLPLAGYVLVQVEANDEKDAIDKAIDADISKDDIEEWATYSQLVMGNVIMFDVNKASAELIDD